MKVPITDKHTYATIITIDFINVVYQEVGHISKWDSFAIFANFCQP
jgi:hypothetical protein